MDGLDRTPGTRARLTKGQEKKEEGDQHQSGGNQNIGVDVPEVDLIHRDSSNFTVNNKNNIPANTSSVNTRNDLI